MVTLPGEEQSARRRGEGEHRWHESNSALGDR